MVRKGDVIYALATVKIASMALFGPLYILIIWIFAVKPDFRKFVAYKIIISIGLMDCLYLLQNLIAGILTFLWSEETNECYENRSVPPVTPKMLNCGFFQLGEAFATMRTGYLLAVPFLSFVLSFNRFAVMLNTMKRTMINVTCWICIALSWIMQLPLPYVLNYAVNTMRINMTDEGVVLQYIQSDVHFFFRISSYSYNGPRPFLNFMGYFGPALELGAFGFTIAVVFVILIQKRMFGSNFRISPAEIRLTAQGFFVTVPLSVVNACGRLASEKLKHTLWFYISWHLLATLLPVINLMVYIIFNPAARRYMIGLLTKWRKPTVATVQSVALKN